MECDKGGTANIRSHTRLHFSLFMHHSLEIFFKSMENCKSYRAISPDSISVGLCIP